MRTRFLSDTGRNYQRPTFGSLPVVNATDGRSLGVTVPQIVVPKGKAVGPRGYRRIARPRRSDCQCRLETFAKRPPTPHSKLAALRETASGRKTRLYNVGHL